MESIKSSSYDYDLQNKTKAHILSLLGVIFFFVPLKIQNDWQTTLCYISSYLDDKFYAFINISTVFFIILSILKKIINTQTSNIDKISIVLKIFGLIIFVSMISNKVNVFALNSEFEFILKDLIIKMSTVLMISSLFMPLILDYGLIEIIESFTQRSMRKMFGVNGSVFFIFLIFLFVNDVCGAFVTYILYKKGKLRQRDTCITILNFSVLSLSLTMDLCNKIDINFFVFFATEMFVLIVCNSIACRIYPLNRKKQSYYFKSNHKNVNCKKNRLNKAYKIYCHNKTDKNLLELSLSYFEESINLLMNLLTTVIIIFFVVSKIYNLPIVVDMTTNLIDLLISKLNLPSSMTISKIISLNFFNNILAIKNTTNEIYYITKIIISLFISIQCINISFLIPFIINSIIDLSLKDIIFVAIQRFIVILFICFFTYNFYIGYIV